LAVAVDVVGTGVMIRHASDEEVRALRRVRLGHDFALDPTRSFRLSVPDGAITSDGVYVVGQAFADLVDGGAEHRWLAAEHHGNCMPRARDATTELLRFADDVAQEGLLELLGDMGIEGLHVSRWTLMSAARRIELSFELEALLVIRR
jgi:hypothetical protein